MFLKSLEAQGFKSFPDKTLLKFERGITAVVGPNGSGKSNISDAIRWVLGEQSNKQLRSEKSEDVIFNGTSKRKAHGFAQVTLCLDNTDRALNCDSDEVYITRRYYRSGESEYQINHATVRLKDVNELFMDTGIGRDGYSMIGQGKISDIVARRSNERRDMFEEAAGISRFRYRKIEAERKLNATEDNLVRLRDIMAELEERVGPLAIQSEKAKKFLALSAEEKELEIGLWLINLEKSKDKLREQEQKIALAQAQYDRVEQKIESIREELETSGSEARKLTVYMDNDRRAVAEMEEGAAKLEGQIAVCENNIFHNNENIDRLRQEMSKETESDADIDQKIDVLLKEIDDRKEQITLLKAKLEESANVLEKLLSESEGLSEKAEALNRSINQNNTKVWELGFLRTNYNTTVSEADQKVASVAEAIVQKKSDIEKTEQEKELLLKDFDRVEGFINECQNTIKGCTLLIASAEQKAEQLKTDYDSILLDAQTKKRRAGLLEEMEKSLEGFGHSVKRVIQEGQNGGLSGIYGPVSRIIKVDEKYSVALEVALGGALYHIVTKTERDAKRAIELLKKERAGRATFLPCETVKPQVLKESGIDDCAGFVGVAQDLVSFDEKFSNVIGSLLGKIIVAEDLQSATYIAKKYGYKFKVVSLDGQVVNTGGSLSGGSFSKATGVLSRQSEIDKLKAEAQSLEQKANDKKKQLDEVQADIVKRKAVLENNRSELSVSNEDRVRILAELKHIESQLVDDNNILADYESQKRDYEKKIIECKEWLDLSDDQEKALLAQIESNEKELESITGGKDEVSKQRESLTEQNNAVRMDIMALEKECDSIGQQISELNSRKVDADSRTEALREQIRELELKIENESTTIAELQSTATELREKAAQTKLNIASQTKEREGLEKKSVDMTNEERELSLDRERLAGETVRLTERRDNMSKEYDDIINKLFDKYEMTKSEAEEQGYEIDDIPAANKRLHEIKSSIRSLGNVNISAVEEYAEVSERYEYMKSQMSDVEDAKTELLSLINQLTSNMQTAFIEQFGLINKYFTETFVELFGGGTAELTLTEPLDVLNSGIDIRVQPPGKNLASIEPLSGGEKSLVALAIYFAMMKVSPPPFCMLDEVETALDDVNVDRFASYLHKMSDRSQFIVVTHRRGTMEQADILYGVTMQEKGVSKFLVLDVNEAEKQLN